MPQNLGTFRPGSRGGYPNQSPLGVIPDTVQAGQNVVPVGPGILRGFAGYASASGTAGDTMFPVKDTSGAIATGSIAYIGRTNNDIYLLIGSGTATVGTTSIGTATGSLQFRIGLTGGTTTAGIPVPGQPTLSANGAGNMTGTYSVKIAYKRSATGAVGNASIASASVSASSNSLKLTGGTVPAGIDRVRVYACARGFSTTGPWLFLAEHTVTPGAALNITALGPNANGQWADGDRGSELAPINNFSPSDLGAVGTHCCTLGSVAVILGDGGYYYSFPGQFETYSPERYGGLPGKVVGLAPRGADGFVYAWGAGWFGALVLTPDGDVIFRGGWNEIGIPNPDAACLVESELWAYTSEPVRTTQAGDPDTSFALAWRDYMRANWTPANVVVGYSPEHNAVVYFHGNEALAYYRAMDAWSLSLTGVTGARACVTVGNRLLVAGSGAGLVGYGNGGGTTWSGLTEFQNAGAEGFLKTISGVKTTWGSKDSAGNSISGSLRIDLYVNLDTTTSVANQTVTATGNAHGAWLYLMQHNVESFALKFSGVGLQSVYSAVVEGTMDRTRF